MLSKHTCTLSALISRYDLPVCPPLFPSHSLFAAGAGRCLSRWRGSKIRVGFAKGDYLQRLKGEWDEAAKAKAAAAAATGVATAARTSSATAPYKARPSLRLRRRPGEVDACVSSFARFCQLQDQRMMVKGLSNPDHYTYELGDIMAFPEGTLCAIYEHTEPHRNPTESIQYRVLPILLSR